MTKTLFKALAISVLGAIAYDKIIKKYTDKFIA
jgi:hypothetical protein